jgi:hypothetical protein
MSDTHQSERMMGCGDARNEAKAAQGLAEDGQRS